MEVSRAAIASPWPTLDAALAVTKMASTANVDFGNPRSCLTPWCRSPGLATLGVPSFGLECSCGSGDGLVAQRCRLWRVHYCLPGRVVPPRALRATRKATMAHFNSTRVSAPDSTVEVSGTHEAARLKPKGGPAADGRGPELDLKNLKSTKTTKKSTIIGCRKETVVGTLNVRTIRDDCRRDVMESRFLGSGVSVMGIQEHRICHGEDLRVEKGRGFCFVSSSAWRTGSGAACGGVGMFLTEAAYRAVKLVKSYTKRILLVSFTGSPALTVICVYSPTEGSDAEEAIGFHQDLRAAIHEVPAHDVLLVVGDLNAHLSRSSPEDPGFYLHPTTNRNGTFLCDTMTECHLVAENHRFQKRATSSMTLSRKTTM